MEKRKTEKTVFTNYVVGSTTDYNQFKIVASNRTIKKSNVTKLMKSFKVTKGMLKSHPIIVDRNLNVIDGQHRLEACKKMGIPVHYLISDDVIESIPIFNSYQEKWGLQDFARYFANNGNNNYVRILKVSELSGITINGCLESLGLKTGGNFNDAFKEGRFTFNIDIDKAVSRINKIIKLCYLLKGKRSITTKIARAIRFLEKIKTFNLDIFIAKVEKYPNKIHGCGTSEEYIDMFIDINNFRLKKEDSITAMDIIVARKEEKEK